MKNTPPMGKKKLKKKKKEKETHSKKKKKSTHIQGWSTLGKGWNRELTAGETGEQGSREKGKEWNNPKMLDFSCHMHVLFNQNILKCYSIMRNWLKKIK